MKVLLLDFSPFGEATTPISLGTLASHLRGLGHQADVLSLGGASSFSPSRLASYLEESAPRLVGFATYQRNLPRVLGLARLVKRTLGGQVILGGPQATFLPEEAFRRMGDVDFLCRSEGELALEAVVEAIEGDALDRPIRGVTHRGGGDLIMTGPPAPGVKDLDDYPSPWLGGVLDPAARDETIMLTSRGCPHDCAFCYTPAASGRRIRFHSEERVLDEIEWVSTRGTGRLWFADPNFAWGDERVTEILEGILRRELSVQMWIEARADRVNREILRLMKRAGVHTMAMGLESGSVRVQEGLEKDIDLERIREVIGLAQEAGIEVELFSQFGLPHERFDDAMKTLEFVLSCGVPVRGNTNAQQMQIYFGSQVSDSPEEYGILPLDEDRPPALSVGKRYRTQWMSQGEIARVTRAWREASVDGGKRVVS